MELVPLFCGNKSNRIKEVLTSKDDIIYDRDAKYFYYKHGPLARVERGHLKVQGEDYAYTINGWLKGVNGNTKTSTRDIGKDAVQFTRSFCRKPVPILEHA